MGAVATEVVEEVGTANPKVELRLHVSGDVTGEWDAARLRQVFSNLIGNAIQHGDKSRPIDVTVEAVATGVWASVRNQGAVIPPAEMPRIFDPLVRGAGATQPRQNRPGQHRPGALHRPRAGALARRHDRRHLHRRRRHRVHLPPAAPRHGRPKD